MHTKYRVFAAILVLSALCLWASATGTKSKSGQLPVDAKSNYLTDHRDYRPLPGGILDDTLATQGFESGVMPPPNWTRIVLNTGDPSYTWHYNANLPPYEGSYAAHVLYAQDLSLQDEWMISPVLDLTSGGLSWQVRFWWNSSYYWGVSPYNNYDLELRISTDGGTSWVPQRLWVEDTVGVFDNYVWYEAEVSLSAYLNQSNVKLGWRYHGADGAQAGIDAITIESVGPVGSVSGTVTDDATPFPPVVGATVEVAGSPLTTTTNASGHYFLTGVSAGTHSLNFTHPAYQSITVPNVVVAENDTTTADVQMHHLNLDFHDYLSSASPSPINDGDTSFMDLNVIDDLLINDLDITINITHTYDSDLTIWIQSPGGERILLSQENGGSGNNFTNTRFDDEASISITNGAAPFTGSFRPEQLLSALDNTSVFGLWTLVVYDGYGGDTGTIDNYTLHVASEVTAAEMPPEGIPASFAFHGNYPNPFNATTEFRFDMGRAGHASLILYNVVGQETARLVDENLSAGSHSVAFNAASLPSGLYLARLTAPGFAATRKVMLLK